MKRRSRFPLLALTGLVGWLAGPGSAMAVAGPSAEVNPLLSVEVGHVVAVEGLATATTPGRPARVLACGDAVHADERLATAPGARLVIARAGRHLHLGPGSLWLARDDAGDQALDVLLRGGVRILDAADLPGSRIATSAGVFRSEAVDLELIRLGDGSLQICDWSRSVHASCRRIDTAGRAWPSVAEGPRVDMGLGHLCAWQGREGYAALDFASTPSVSAGPADLFEPDFDPEPDAGEPGCAGDECSPDPDLPDPSLEWSVAPTGIFIP